MRLKRYITEEGGFKHNVDDMSLEKARQYSEDQFTKAGKDLDKVLPNFDANYTMLKKNLSKAINIPRIQMPVIEPEDMDKFQKSLVKGEIDIMRPYAGGKLSIQKAKWKPMKKKEGEEWIKLGIKDGDPNDDKINAIWTKIKGGDLIPTQSQIWLEKLVGNIIKFGPPTSSSPVLRTTIITSREGYILDGHHRFGQVMLADPSLKINALKIPMDIRFLLKIGRSYGAAIGRKPKG